jgi:hypothetical protein
MTTCEGRRSRSVVLAALALASLAARSRAAEAQTEDPAAARVLFNEARALIKDGQFAPACPKLEAAAKLYRGSGILLNLADCYEHIGRTASAWNQFAEAASLASRAGRADDEAEARRRQALLEPLLSHVVVRVKEAVPGLTLAWDGQELLSAAWETAIPVDTGHHDLAANASGYTPWSTSLDVAAGASEAVEIPRLELAPVQPPPLVPEASPPAAPYWTTRRKVGVGVASGGVVALGVAGALALVADVQYNNAKSESGTARVHDSSTAVTTGNVATVVSVVGAAAAALGAVVWFTAKTAPVRVGASPAAIGGSF